MGDKLDTLIGKTVQRIYVGPGERQLWLEFSDGCLLLDTEGDCCSESWWADILGVKQLIGNPITDAEAIDLPDPQDERSRQLYDQAYGIRIRTTGGECDLIFRNSSNGYYGGWFTASWEDTHGVAVEIKEDWHA